MAAPSVLSHSTVTVVVVWEVKAEATGDAGDSQAGSCKTPFLPTSITGIWSQILLYLCTGMVGCLAASLVSTHWMPVVCLFYENPDCHQVLSNFPTGGKWALVKEP